jgi:hypothetical protein
MCFPYLDHIVSQVRECIVPVSQLSDSSEAYITDIVRFVILRIEKFFCPPVKVWKPIGFRYLGSHVVLDSRLTDGGEISLTHRLHSTHQTFFISVRG